MLTLLALLSSAQAAPVSFLSQDREWMNIYVDGARVGEVRSFDLEVQLDLRPGIHKVELKDFMDRKTYDSGWLTVPRSATLDLAVSKRGGMQVLQDPRLLTERPPEATACRADKGSHQVTLVMRNIDSAWANVRVDGRLVAELRGASDLERVSLSPGIHQVEVRDFMDRELWSSGRLVVGCTSLLEMGIGEDRAPIVYNDPNAWI